MSTPANWPLHSLLLRFTTCAVLGTFGVLLFGPGCKAHTAGVASQTPSSQVSNKAPAVTLQAFHSEEELRAFMKKRMQTMRSRAVEYEMQSNAAVKDSVVMQDKSPSPPVAMLKKAEVAGVSSGGDRSITNNQVEGVDEGDIVKVHNNIMVVLRRGRIFTISLANGEMRPIDHVNAYPPGVNASSDWYDEMLFSGNQVIVIGYSYSRGGTEINRFQLNEDGRISFLDSYQLSSSDYYSSRNYASRLIGSKLIFYAPRSFYGSAEDPLDNLPTMRKWTGRDSKFHRITSATEVYIPADLRDSDNAEIDTLHSITTCDLTARDLNCKATGVLGNGARTYFVASNAVYLWTAMNTGPRIKDAHALVYRLPLNGDAPQAVAARGVPVDQFAFQEDANANMLNVLVRSESAGDKMWRSEFSAGSVALARIPLDAFGDGSEEVSKDHYTFLPKPQGGGYDFHERFVGNYVLYGNGNGWGEPSRQSNTLTAVRVSDGNATQIKIPFAIDRIESLGSDGLVVGSSRSNLYFASIELTGRADPRFGDSYKVPLAVQSESRSHSFFYQPNEDSADGASGIMGLPVARPATAAYQQLFQNSVAMVFLRRTDRAFSPLGEIAAHSKGIRNDTCVASCVDWYGNARPIFLNNRVFALLGYELVEGHITSHGIEEIDRTNFTPGAPSVRVKENRHDSSWD